MNLKPEELVKALHCCAEGECSGCPMYADKQRCQEQTLASSADQIEHDQKEIAELKAKVEQFAAYEDTGLTPEEIKAPFTEDAMINLAAQALGVEPSRLRELAVADKDGHVVVLPCKVGDVVYGFHGEKTILPMVAKWIETNTDGWCIAVQYTPMAQRFYRFSDFGKTVFLTREEAKKALREMEGKKDG